MDFSDVIKTRRSIRQYSDRQIDDATVQRVLDAARMAPSANNTQPWHFVVVRDAARRAKLVELASGQSFIAQAPAVIAVCGKCYTSQHSWIGANMYLVDVAIAMDHLTLAARNEGLGTCWIGAFDHDAVHAFLEVPDTHRVVILTPLGYPLKTDAFQPTTRRYSLDSMISNEKFT
ncbi:MAG: nitroreductase family protein [Phycisphaerae bacterium]|nr:nitroreductase family protein [Phycisphaerae bacterium]